VHVDMSEIIHHCASNKKCKKTILTLMCHGTKKRETLPYDVLLAVLWFIKSLYSHETKCKDTRVYSSTLYTSLLVSHQQSKTILTTKIYSIHSRYATEPQERQLLKTFLCGW